MSDLLVGCKALYYSENDPNEKEGVIVKVDRAGINKVVWILKQNGSITGIYLESIKIHLDDVRFIHALNKNYKLREKILTESTDRFSILDL